MGEEGAKGMIGDGGEVVTRYPYRKVRMDHLLSKLKRSDSDPVVIDPSQYVFWCTLFSFEGAKALFFAFLKLKRVVRRACSSVG